MKIGIVFFTSLLLNDLVKSLQTLSARRLLLNHQRSLIWRMQQEGALEEAEANHLIKQIEMNMRRIRNFYKSGGK